MDVCWHRMALTTLLLATGVSLGGCFSSYGTPDPGAGDAATAPPSPRPGPPDSGTEPAEPPPPTSPTPPATGCRGSGPAGAVTVALGFEGGVGCEFGEHEGAQINDLGLQADGIVILADLCPYDDEDCQCAIAVGGVGGDILEDLAGISTTGLVRLDIAPGGIVIERPCADDPCDGGGDCECPADLLFAAMDGPPSAPPVHTEALSASYAGELCRVSDSGLCDYVMWGLELVSWSPGFPGPIGTAVTLEQGQTIRGGEHLPGLSARVLRSSGMECGAVEEVPAAWVAWATVPGV